MSVAVYLIVFCFCRLEPLYPTLPVATGFPFHGLRILILPSPRTGMLQEIPVLDGVMLKGPKQNVFEIPTRKAWFFLLGILPTKKPPLGG
jgi:hypothetical protein